MKNNCNILDKIKEEYSKYICCPKHDVGMNHLYVDKNTFIQFMEELKKDLLFDLLFDHIVVDHIKENVFHLVYLLYSTKYNREISIIVEIPRHQPVISTLCHIWKIAEWQEREAYDLFGILYNNHPDLRRVFLEDDWVGYPLRKNYQDNFILEK
jgi:NADH:ubiquinone oxidoreductase subunit C